MNYDGQLTKQHGIHSRFESVLFERFREELLIAPTPATGIATPRDFIFDLVIEGSQLVAPILRADLEAIGTRDVYDDAYFAAFLSKVKPVLERRLNEAITAVAGMIIGAWEAAGKPPVPVNPPPTLQRRR